MAVVLSWVGIVAGLIVLVATFGGSLKDAFEIPGSETQKATDLIESEFASEQGGVLNVVFAAPEGSAWTRPSASKRSRKRSRSSEPRVQAHQGQGWDRQRRHPFDPNTVSDDGRIAYAEAQFDRVVYAKDRDSSSPSRTQSERRWRPSA